MSSDNYIPKFKKKVTHMRGVNRGVATRCNDVAFGFYAMKATKKHAISNIMLATCRRILSNSLNRIVKVYIRIFPNQAYTKKPLAVRMGRGKGEVVKWQFQVKPGTVIAEIAFCNSKIAYQALRTAVSKLPIKCKVFSKLPSEDKMGQIVTSSISKDDQ